MPPSSSFLHSAVTVNHFSSGTWTPRLYDCFHIRERLVRISPCCKGTAVAKERHVAVHCAAPVTSQSCQFKRSFQSRRTEGSTMEPPVGGAPLFLYSHVHLFIYLHSFVNACHEPVSVGGVVRDPKTKMTEPLPRRKLYPNPGCTW